MNIAFQLYILPANNQEVKYGNLFFFFLDQVNTTFGFQKLIQL